jgi:signal transduction histidine kinase
MKAKGQLGSEQDWLCLNIADDGVGFDVSAMSQTQARTTGHGYGFIDMRRRVEEFSGTFIFDSEPGKGTRLTALFPMNTEQETLAEGSIRL